MTTREELSERDQAWKRRMDAVAFMREQTLYVTPEEYRDIRDLAALHELLDPPEAVAGRRFMEQNVTLTDYFWGTPLVVDATEAAAQAARVNGERRGELL